MGSPFLPWTTWNFFLGFIIPLVFLAFCVQITDSKLSNKIVKPSLYDLPHSQMQQVIHRLIHVCSLEATVWETGSPCSHEGCCPGPAPAVLTSPRGSPLSGSRVFLSCVLSCCGAHPPVSVHACISSVLENSRTLSPSKISSLPASPWGALLIGMLDLLVLFSRVLILLPCVPPPCLSE